jgi:hypothetical protein
MLRIGDLIADFFPACSIRDFVDVPHILKRPAAETTRTAVLSVSLLVDVSRGSNLRLKLDPATTLGMRVERGLKERDAARAILYHRRPEGERIGRRARLPRRQDVGIIAIERGRRLENTSIAPAGMRVARLAAGDRPLWPRTSVRDVSPCKANFSLSGSLCSQPM